MKKILLSILSLFVFASSLFSQGFTGINAGNYGGITGVMLQPASIVDSRFKFDINLFSTDLRFSNNYLQVDRSLLLKFNKNNFDGYPAFRDRYLSNAALAPGDRAFFNISNRTQLPLSFMATLSEKSAIAFNLQSRSMVQGRNITAGLANLAFNNFYNAPSNSGLLDASGVALQSLSWVEAGITYGRVLFENGNHFLKGAVTGKYLGGVSSLNLSANNLSVQVNNDSSFNFTSDRVNYDHNENADFSRVIDSRFRPDANAFGFDAGLVYEFRGHLNNIKYIRNDDEKSYEVKRRDLNKYIFRLGVSVVDAGIFRFTKAENLTAFSANITNWNIRNANYSSIINFDTALGNRVTPLATGAPREYNVYLPGALSVQLDVRFVKGLFLNAVAYRPLKIGSEAGTRFDNYGYYTITPRYERRHFGIYLPYTFFDKESISNYRDNWLGLTLRLGPVFLGSSNLGSVAFNDRIQAADFFVGVKIGSTYGKPSKISRYFAAKKDADYETLATEKDNRERREMTTRRYRNPEPYKMPRKTDTAVANRMVLDYSKGQVYSNGRPGQVIVMNNYYYYGNSPATRPDSVYNSRIILPGTQQNMYRIDSNGTVNAAQKRKTDSTNRVLNDTLMKKREQLDSLINRLNNLRRSLDTVASEDNSSNFNNEENNTAGIFTDSTRNNAIAPDQYQVAGDSLENRPLKKDSVVVKKATKKNLSKKKSRADRVEKQSEPLVVDDRTERSRDYNSTPRNYNVAVAPRQTVSSTETYDAYMRQSERLQEDIARLERQMANNRSVVNVTPQRNYNPPVYYNVTAPPSNVYPATVPASIQKGRDTVVIRDTVFVTKRDTITREVVSAAPAIVSPTPNEKIVTEKINYKNLPPENILFATGQAAIGQVYLRKLAYLADILNKNAELKIAITGHTDKTGSPAVNERLSLKRADAVKMYFQRKGIAESRMQVTALAAEDPLVTGKTKNANMQNRRVEIHIVE